MEYGSMISDQPLTADEVVALAEMVGRTRHEQAKALGISTAQLGRYLVDGVTNKCSFVMRDRMVQAARERGVI